MQKEGKAKKQPEASSLSTRRRDGGVGVAREWMTVIQLLRVTPANFRRSQEAAL